MISKEKGVLSSVIIAGTTIGTGVGAMLGGVIIIMMALTEQNDD